MSDDLDLPIALRRTRRSSIGTAHNAQSVSVSWINSQALKASHTPQKQRPKKRVRFSDPGLSTESVDTQNAYSSTGLTPMVRRTALRTSPSPKRRRHSTPAHKPGLTLDTESPYEISPPAFQQTLDDRAKRRMRRNGLSEEMNKTHEEKRRRKRDIEAELERLKAELESRDEEIEKLRDTARIHDTERIIELEKEVEELRGELNQRPDAQDQSQLDWTLAAKDPFSDSYMDLDHGFGDSTVADIACSTPSRARSSFPTPPSTSPFMPSTPCSSRRFPLTPQSHHSVQVSLPDPEKEALEAELGSLRLELTKLTDALEVQAALKSRIQEKLADASSNTDASRNLDIEIQLDGVLRNLSDRTAALFELNSSLSSLGFPGNDASEIVSSLTSAFRSARLELEYLTPGEITLPLSSHGAEVLDLILTRLRELARKARDDENTIDEYHALELSLRQQLGARVQAMDDMGKDIGSRGTQLKEKDAHIAELQVGIDRLKGAVEGYRRDVTELETLVERMDRDGKKKEAELQVTIDAGEVKLRRKDECISDLNSKLASFLTQVETLEKQVEAVETKRALNIASINRNHGAALALRDARVSELRVEIDRINESLRKAHETIHQLRLDNAGLTSRIDSEKSKAKEAVDSMKAELERVLQTSQGLLATPQKTKKSGARRSSAESSSANSGIITPESVVRPGSFLSGDLARKGKKRRRYDSGLGFLDEDEVDV